MKNFIKFNYNSFIKTLNQKKFFLIQVYGTLIFQIFIAYIVLLYAENISINLNRIKTICLSVFLSFCLISIIFTILYIKSPILKFILFMLFSACIGLFLSLKFDNRFIHNIEEENEIIKKAFITTCIVFIYLIVFGFFATFMGSRISPTISISLFFMLLLLIIVLFVLSLTGTYKFYYKIIVGFIIFLFSLYIIYDTISILDRNYSGDFISAALDYFIDFINIFNAFIEIN